MTIKLSDFVPDIKAKYREIDKINQFTNFFDFLSKSVGGEDTTPAFGVNKWTNAWVQQRIGYRRQLLLDLWSLYLSTAEVRSPITVIRNEVFRRGLKWEPKFAKKCIKCGKEYDEIINMCEVEHCKGEVKDPDEEQKNTLDGFIPKVNIFNQSLLEVLGGFEDNLNWADDGFIYLRKEYQDINGKIKSKVLEIRNLHPGMVDIDLDDNGLPDNKRWTCYLHRDVMEIKAGKCKKCMKEDGRDLDLVPITWIYYHQGTEPLYLLREEILHMTKFSHTEIFGISPLITLYDKILSLVGTDKTTLRYFYERKLPAGMLLVATDDPEGLRRERTSMEAKMKMDPDYMPMVAYSARQGSRGRVDFIKLFHTILETDYLPIKNDIRDRIAAMWGVSPIWMTSQESSGGIATQSQELVVTSRVVEADQKRFNEKVLPFILDSFGITDWVMVLEQPEEKAESTRLQFMQQRVTAAMQLKQMGFKVKLVPGIKALDDIDFEVAEVPEGEEGSVWEAGTPEFMSSGILEAKPKLHAHGAYPPHPINMHHEKNRSAPQENGIWQTYNDLRDEEDN